MKIAIASHVLPPSSSGQAIVLYRLLKDLDPKSYCLVSSRKYNSDAHIVGYTEKLTGRYYKIFAEHRLGNPIRYNQGLLYPVGLIIRLFNIAVSFLGIFFRGIQIARILRQEKCNAIVACTADLVNIPACYLASRLAGVSYYPYIFDYYSYQWTEPFSRLFADFLEPIILKGATNIMVPNEFLHDELMKRYGVESTIIHNPCEVIEGKEDIPWPSKEGEISIVYTGAIYYVHYDAFRNLIAAIEMLGRDDIMLHIYTSEPRSSLESVGICGPVVYHNHLELSEALEIQRQADILFLPLAFESTNPEIIKTSSPGKMGEYLATGRPILVHSPSDSFVSWYFKKYGCGAVADENDVSALARNLRSIIENDVLRKQMIANALQRARDDFDLTHVRAKFINSLKAKG